MAYPSVSSQMLGLVEYPERFPVDMVELRYSGSFTTHIIPDFFRNCVNLTTLDLSNNHLVQIEPFALDDLARLDTLILTKNRLFYNATTFPNGMFTRLPSLRVLRLEDQKQFAMPMFTTPLDFQTFVGTLPSRLQVLYVDLQIHPCVEIPSSVFKRFTNLTQLGLFSRNSCSMKLNNDTFAPLENLPVTKLRIRFDNLVGVEPLAFSWFTNLTVLEMNDTQGMTVADFYPAWTGLKSTQISQLLFTSFKRNSFNNKTDLLVLNNTFFEELNFTTLNALSLADTGLRAADSWTFHDRLPNLKYLSVANNSIDVLELTQMTLVHAQVNCRISSTSMSVIQREQMLMWSIFLLILSPRMGILTVMGINEFLQAHDMTHITLTGNNSLSRIDFRYNFLRSLPLIHIWEPNTNHYLTVDLSHNELVFISPRLFIEDPRNHKKVYNRRTSIVL